MRNENGSESTSGEALTSAGSVIDVEPPRSGNGRATGTLDQAIALGSVLQPVSGSDSSYRLSP